MKTLIEQFVTQVLSSTENFTLTDGIHNITCTQFKRGQAIFVYGNVSGSYELNLNISAEKVTLRLYAIVREGQIYFYDLNCFGIYAGEDKQKLPKDCMTLKEYQELWKERQRQLIKEYQEEFLEGKLLREKPNIIETSLKTAHGHEDNPSVQAARRMLKKRGIDWKTGKKLKTLEDDSAK